MVLDYFSFKLIDVREQRYKRKKIGRLGKKEETNKREKEGRKKKKNIFNLKQIHLKIKIAKLQIV